MVERSLSMREAVGSMPTFSILKFTERSETREISLKLKQCQLRVEARLAQSVERQPFKLVVVGSSPTSGEGMVDALKSPVEMEKLNK